MLRLTDLKLPLDHPWSALSDAIPARLGIGADELIYSLGWRHGARSSLKIDISGLSMSYNNI